jgi:WS/DGAT/MGAT family acyltransferase
VVIDRLSDEDAMMLWPDEVWPQDVGALIVLEGGRLLDEEGRLRIETVRDLIASRLPQVPRFRQLLQVPPGELGSPFWIDAQNFDISYHVKQAPLPMPGDEAQLLLATERIRRRRLDRSRPLWEMWFLTRLHDGRLGLFIRFHHTIADGMAGIATIATFLDTDPKVIPAAPATWSPAPAPTSVELRDDQRRRRLERRRQRWARLAHPIATGRRLLAAWPAVRELLAERPYPATSLDHLVGQDRNLALIRADLDPIKQVAHHHGATVNDVLLTAIAGGLRALLASRGETVNGLVLGIYVPVSLHRGPRSTARGNLISQMAVPLPITGTDPTARMHQIAAATADRKAIRRPSLGSLPHRGIPGRVFLRLVNRQHVNVTSADLPGPEVPLYLAGARLLDVFPMVQLLGHNSLAVGALSYAGGFDVMAVADRDAYPDLEVFTRGTEAELAALMATVTNGRRYPATRATPADVRGPSVSRLGAGRRRPGRRRGAERPG